MKELALVGCAHIHTPNFIKVMAERKDIRVSCIWDPCKSKAEEAAAKLGGKVVDSPDAVWSDANVDSVVICSETNRHLELVRKAADARRNIYVEKPLGMGAADSWEMAKAIQKAGVLFQTGYFLRGNGINRFLREQLQAGAFGKVTRIRHQNCHSGSLGGWFDTTWRWMAEPAIAGVGAFGDLGFHSLDIMLWLLGAAPETVTATTQVVTGRYGDACDETGEAILKFADGTIGSMAAGWVDVQQPVTLLLSGTEGHAAVINNQLFFKSSHVEGADGLKPWTALPENEAHPFVQFLDAVTGKPASLIPVSEAALDSAVMEAMYLAAKTDSWCKPVLG